MKLKDISGFLDDNEDDDEVLEDQELKEPEEPEEPEEPKEKIDPLKFIIAEQLASKLREAEEKTEMIPDIVERGMEILRNSIGYYKLSFMGVLEKEFPMVSKRIVRTAVSEIIKRDDIEITTSMRMTFVGVVG